jgi:hypothetical protein
MGGNIPGFQMLKDRVLKPLIVATEKVVEYYLNEDQVRVDPEGQMKEYPMDTQTVSTHDQNPLQS